MGDGDNEVEVWDEEKESGKKPRPFGSVVAASGPRYVRQPILVEKKSPF